MIRNLARWRLVPDWSTLWLIGGVALAYWAAAQVALRFVSLPGGITPIWPSSGIALAAVLLLGARVAPGIFLGVMLLVLFRGQPLTAQSLTVEVIGGLGTTAESCLTAAILAYLLPSRTPLRRSQDSFQFVAVAWVAPVLSATIGTMAACGFGLDPWSEFWPIWGGWWISNVFGIWIVTPTLISWHDWLRRRDRLSGLRMPSSAQLIEGMALTVGAIAISDLVFRQSLPLEYILVPLLIWAVFRLGHAFTMLLVIAIALIAVIGTADGLGPFVKEGRPEWLSLLLLQLFIGVATLTVLVLSAAIAERQAAQAQLMQLNQTLSGMADQLQASNQALEQTNDDLELRMEQRTRALNFSEDKFTKVFRSSPNPIIISRLADGCILDVNDSFIKLSGYRREQVINRASTDVNIWVNPSLRQELIQRLRSEGVVRDYEADFRIQDGEVRIGLLSAEIISLDGQECLLSSVNDITDRKRAEAALHIEQQKSERLLLNILPQAIATQLKQREGEDRSLGDAIAEHFDEVSILFADIVGFTPLSERLEAIALVNLLNQVFSTFDQLAEGLGLEKIKTIGDAYMVASGLPTPRADHAEAIADMSLAMQAATHTFQEQLGEPLRLRIGINSGIVVAGVIGKKKFIYDLWGDAVNIASRMESSGEPDGIQVTEETYQRLKDRYLFNQRGTIYIKGKGNMSTYWLVGRK
ncbi:MAG TPA: adenylate/guanylate cyclase domain-containing protein [Chroococcidiopsis sp.]